MIQITPLDYSAYLEIKTDDNKNCIYSKDGKLHLTLQMYGGKEVAEKVTSFYKLMNLLKLMDVIMYR